jgi:hypothetical protein
VNGAGGAESALKGSRGNYLPVHLQHGLGVTTTVIELTVLATIRRLKTRAQARARLHAALSLSSSSNIRFRRSTPKISSKETPGRSGLFVLKIIGVSFTEQMTVTSFVKRLLSTWMDSHTYSILGDLIDGRNQEWLIQLRVLLRALSWLGRYVL